MFTRLQPRQYSISSSPLVDPHRIRLTVSIVRYRTGGRARKGVCSTFLADADGDAIVPVFVQRAPHFRIPARASAPAVMIGPGTGVAPFLGFLDERRARGHDGRNWLFFGEQRQATDHYYERELAELCRPTACSTTSTWRSPATSATKVYVQDRMREHGARLWSWLQDGAHVYVCGDMTRMAADVDATLHEIVQTHGGLDPDAAAEYVQQLTADHRYARDVYWTVQPLLHDDFVPAQRQKCRQTRLAEVGGPASGRGRAARGPWRPCRGSPTRRSGGRASRRGRRRDRGLVGALTEVATVPPRVAGLDRRGGRPATRGRGGSSRRTAA